MLLWEDLWRNMTNCTIMCIPQNLWRCLSQRPGYGILEYEKRKRFRNIFGKTEFSPGLRAAPSGGITMTEAFSNRYHRLSQTMLDNENERALITENRRRLAAARSKDPQATLPAPDGVSEPITYE